MTRAADVFRGAAIAFQAGDLRLAESLCRETRDLEPGSHGPSFMLGLLLKRRGALPEAAREFLCAAQLAPNDFASHYEAGLALAGCGLLPQAIGHLACACTLNPGSVEARLDLGTMLRVAGRSSEAVAHYRDAVRTGPEVAAYHNNLGACLLDVWKFDEALACFERALQLVPNLPDAHQNRANALKELGCTTEAVRAYRRAIELRPSFRDAHTNLLFAMMFDPESSPAAILEQAKLFQARFLTLPETEILPPVRCEASERRLRIGYVCADFREHVFMLLLPQLLREHDRERVEVFCYSNVRRPDAITKLYSELADHFRSIVGLDDATAARVIREDRIDVLIDITMHMAYGRLGVFARRPAPIQVTWLAYPGTTGADCIDVRLSDPHLDPPGSEHLYSERTARLPDSFWCYEPMVSDLAVNELPARTQGSVTFGCLNNPCKTNDTTFALWARVLCALPTSRLLLLMPPGSARQRTCAFFEQAGVTSDRIEFVDFQLRVNYLKTYGRIDIALDTLPYNGHTTSLDALWMGVPVVTLVGDTVAGRAGLSQAKNLGMEELCAETPDDFCTRAVALASDLERLALLRAGLRERMQRSPLMDARRFARNFEQTLRQLFDERTA